MSKNATNNISFNISHQDELDYLYTRLFRALKLFPQQSFTIEAMLELKNKTFSKQPKEYLDHKQVNYFYQSMIPIFENSADKKIIINSLAKDDNFFEDDLSEFEPLINQPDSYAKSYPNFISKLPSMNNAKDLERLFSWEPSPKQKEAFESKPIIPLFHSLFFRKRIFNYLHSLYENPVFFSMPIGLFRFCLSHRPFSLYEFAFVAGIIKDCDFPDKFPKSISVNSSNIWDDFNNKCLDTVIEFWSTDIICAIEETTQEPASAITIPEKIRNNMYKHMLDDYFPPEIYSLLLSFLLEEGYYAGLNFEIKKELVSIHDFLRNEFFPTTCIGLPSIQRNLYKYIEKELKTFPSSNEITQNIKRYVAEHYYSHSKNIIIELEKKYPNFTKENDIPSHIEHCAMLTEAINSLTDK